MSSTLVRTTRRRRSRTLRIAALVAAAALALAACGDDAEDDASDKDTGGSGDSSSLGDITVQLSGSRTPSSRASSSPTTAATTPTPASTASTCCPARSRTEELVATGKADFGLSNAISTGAAIANSDFPLKIVGTTYQKNPFSILSLADGGNIVTPEDLIGKKIGVQDPNLSLFNALLAANGIDPDDVTVVPNGFDIAPLEDGQIDGLVAYVTNESLLVAGDGFDTTDLGFADNGLPFVAESVIATDDTIAEPPRGRQGVPQGRDPGLEGRLRRPGRRRDARRREVRRRHRPAARAGEGARPGPAAVRPPGQHRRDRPPTGSSRSATS